MTNLTIDAAGATDTGLVRATNEDHHLIGAGLFAVADGMGGAANGQVASRLATETLQRAFSAEPTASGLVAAVRQANEAIRDRAGNEPDQPPFGTTIGAVARVGGPDDERFVTVNVGDTRIYLLRDGQLTQLSSDHSRVADLVRAGEITASEAAEHPERHVLTSALGVVDAVAPAVNHVRPEPGDRLILCSDGLFNELTEEAIAATAARHDDLDRAARDLIDQAKASGGADNITVVLVEVT